MDIATEKESMEVVDLLWEAIGEEIPDKVKLLQLSRAMYKEDTEEAKKKFKELLRSLTPELVRFSLVGFFTGDFGFFQVSISMEVCFKTLSLKAKLTLSAFYWNMGAV